MFGMFKGNFIGKKHLNWVLKKHIIYAKNKQTYP